MIVLHGDRRFRMPRQRLAQRPLDRHRHLAPQINGNAGVGRW
jgi:hypothetical protein